MQKIVKSCIIVLDFTERGAIMFFPYDCHIHTTFCDGTLNMESMALQAYRMGYKAIGFSVHSPLPYKNDYALRKEDEKSYIKTARMLKAAYRGKMDVLMGVEWDYDTQYGFPEYEYRIGSVHQIGARTKHYAIDNTPDELENCIKNVFESHADAFLSYYFSAVEASCMRRGVDIVGHFDLPTKLNGHSRFFDENGIRYRELAVNALQRIVSKRPDLIFEVNVGGMYRANRRFPYPAPFLLRELARLHVKITLTSDAHDQSALAYQEAAVLSLCRNCGHRAVYGLSSRGLIEVLL